MRALASALFALAGLINVIPVTGALSAARLEVLYGLRFEDPSLVILMRHRAVLLGIVGTLFAFLFEGPLVEITVWGSNLGYFAFYVFGYNLRHSHIWLPYPRGLSHIFISPAQHQIHHSTAPRHYDKNFGFLFAFWDWMAGSLYVPASKESIEFGLTGFMDEVAEVRREQQLRHATRNLSRHLLRDVGLDRSAC